MKKDNLLSLTMLIVFFQTAVYLTRFVLNGISCLILLLPIISGVFKVTRPSFFGGGTILL